MADEYTPGVVEGHEDLQPPVQHADPNVSPYDTEENKKPEAQVYSTDRESNQPTSEDIEQNWQARKMRIMMQHEKAARDSVLKLQNDTAPMWDRYRQMLQEDMALREQQPQMQQLPPIPQEQKNKLIGAVGTMLAIAVPLAFAFGRKGNGFAKGAMMSALGNGLKAYVEGDQKRAELHMKNWEQQVKTIKDSNNQRQKLFQDVWKNKKLELDDQFDLTKSLAEEFQQPYIARGAQLKNMPMLIKEFQNQEKAKTGFEKGTGKIRKDVAKDWQDYRQYVLSMTHQQVDADKDPEAANKKLPYTEFHDKFSSQSARTAAAKAAEEAVGKDAKAPMSQEDIQSSRDKLFGPTPHE